MKTNKRHYHVIENTPGYLPDSDPVMFSTIKEARSYAVSLAQELRESGYRVSGCAKNDFYYAELNPNDLGRVIEINTCHLSECLGY